MIDLYYLDIDDNCVCIRHGRTGECVDSFRFYVMPGEHAGDAIEQAQRALDSLNAQWRAPPVRSTHRQAVVVDPEPIWRA